MIYLTLIILTLIILNIIIFLSQFFGLISFDLLEAISFLILLSNIYVNIVYSLHFFYKSLELFIIIYKKDEV
jgi:hypothetical protein